MRRTIVILSVFVLLASGCNQATTSQVVETPLTYDTRIEAENEEHSLEIYQVTESLEKNLQIETVWTIRGVGTTSFVRFQPDALLPDTIFFDADLIGLDIPFRVYEAYRVGGLRLLFGHANDGQPSEIDSESDWGLRLLAFNDRSQLVFRSRGAFDSRSFWARFFASSDNKQVLILCELGDEMGSMGAVVFLVEMETSKIFEIGHVSEPYDTELWHGPVVSDIIDIQRVDNTLVFSFTTDHLTLMSDFRADTVVTINHKYVFSEGKRTRVNLHTLHLE